MKLQAAPRRWKVFPFTEIESGRTQMYISIEKFDTHVTVGAMTGCAGHAGKHFSKHGVVLQRGLLFDAAEARHVRAVPLEAEAVTFIAPAIFTRSVIARWLALGDLATACAALVFGGDKGYTLFCQVFDNPVGLTDEGKDLGAVCWRPVGQLHRSECNTHLRCDAPAYKRCHWESTSTFAMVARLAAPKLVETAKVGSGATCGLGIGSVDTCR